MLTQQAMPSTCLLLIFLNMHVTDSWPHAHLLQAVAAQVQHGGELGEHERLGAGVLWTWGEHG